MSREKLQRAAEEIKTALDTATSADQTSRDPELSFIESDTFKQIARPLRRALRLISEKPRQQSAAEREADLLFDVMNGEDADAIYEIGCVLDEVVDPNRAYSHRHIFTLLYIEAIRADGRDETLSVILRQLKKGVTPGQIARQLKEGTLK